MSQEAAPRPMPMPDADSKPFWEGVQERQLRLQQCGSCQRHIYYARVLCPHCHGEDLRWRTASGAGVIHSFTVSRRPAGAGFADEVPYVVALIDLREGPRMLSNIVDARPEDVSIGESVEVDFRDVGDGHLLPVFRLLER